MAPLVTGAQWQHLLGAAGLCQPAAGLGGTDDDRDKTHPHHSQYPWQALGAFPTWNIPETTIICIAFVELGHVQLFFPLLLPCSVSLVQAEAQEGNIP